MGVGTKRRKQVDRKRIARKTGDKSTVGNREKVRKPMTKARIAFFVILAVLAVAIIIVVKNIITLSIEKNKLTNQEKELQGKKDELTAELQGVDDLDYIEEQARKLLKMIKPGEVLYILNGENPRPESEGEEETLPEPSGTPTPTPAAPQEEVVTPEPEPEPEEIYYEETPQETSETEGTTETEEALTSEETYQEDSQEETSSEEYSETTEEASGEAYQETYEGEGGYEG